MTLRELPAKASPPRSGDELAGVVAMARAIRAEADGRRSADEGAGGVVRTAGERAMKLRELLAKASPPRSGDELTGVVAIGRAIRSEADGRRSADEGAGGVVRTAQERAR